ncbi:MAG: tetratricopeptide repeat protein [Desulfuromonadaceae bacterium]
MKCSRTGTAAFLSIALVVIILIVYMQVGNHEFLNFDDYTYITNNPHVASGLTVPNIMWAVTSVDAANWHPVTWLSHMADVQLYGMNPRGHHLTNVAIHTFTALLVFFFLFRLTDGLWQSLFVAALFALHPLHVESVAWVAERKDVLSAFFWFLTLLFYASYVAKRKMSLYIAALCAFVLGLMSKPMLVTLPVVMLLLDYWPLDRYRDGEKPGARQLLSSLLPLVKEKIPFFACSLFSALITIHAQHKGGAVQGLSEISFRLRSENALIAYVKYIGKTLWPHDLAVLYPFPPSIPSWQVTGSLFIMLLVSAAAVNAGRSHPYVAAGWFWFLITLVPVIGLIQVGGQAMADRYSYIPLTGLFIIAAWGVPDLARGLRYRQVILALLAGTVITASAALTRHQLGYWRDNISLYRHTLQITTDNPGINYNQGLALQAKGDLDAAIREYRESLRIAPNSRNSHYNLALALQTRGDLNAAIQEYRQALRINPDNINAHYNLGLALAGKGDLDAAIQEYREALRINHTNANAHNNLGAALATKGDLDAAIQEYREALRINPDIANAHNNLGAVHATRGNLDAAIQEFQEALRINPNYANAHDNLDAALAQKRVQDEAGK